MINCSITGVCALCSQLKLYQLVFDHELRHGFADDVDGPISDKLKTDVQGWLRVATIVSNDFELDAVHDRIEVIERRLQKQTLTGRDISTEMRVLLETLDAGLKNHLLYRYPKDRGQILRNWKDDWGAVLKRFPSAEQDILAGVDLWALHHATPSVFQFMRVLEHGLRALAQDVGKTFDVQNWQNIIEEIESEIRQLRKSLPRGQDRSERLQFLSEAAKEFVYFKDGWRNHVSHNRGVYDDHQARSIMEHVRAFMTTLSSAEV